jgi:hypothetical protein
VIDDLAADEEEPGQFNLWRQTSLAFHLLQIAINPFLSLKECIDHWYVIGKGLAEGNQKRIRQLCKAYSYQQKSVVFVN